MFHRKLPLPAPGEDTFFLWGPRQTGKSTLLKERYPQSALAGSEGLRRLA